MSHGFLKSRSVSHSVEPFAKSGVTPASSSSQFFIGVTSTATAGPKDEPPPFTFQFPAPPASTIAAGSLSGDWAEALALHTNKPTVNAALVTRMIVLQDARTKPHNPHNLSGQPRSSFRTTSARMHQNVCLLSSGFRRRGKRQQGKAADVFSSGQRPSFFSGCLGAAPASQYWLKPM